MTFGNSYHTFSPEITPSCLKKLIGWYIGLSLFIQLFNTWPPDFFSLPSLKAVFSLSIAGIEKGFLWQPLTYLFVNGKEAGNAVSFSYLVSLAFDMYFLWILGCTILDYLGEKRFFQLLIGSQILVGLISLFFLFLIHSTSSVSGIVPVLFSLLMVWGMLAKEARLFFFFAIPMKLKTLLSIVFGLTLLIELSNQNGIGFIFYLTGILAGYLYGTLFLELKSPFFFTEKLDLFLFRIKDFLLVRSKPKSKSKVFDFLTGEEILDDEAFVDAMLAKISRQGENSLTRQERARLDKISNKKH